MFDVYAINLDRRVDRKQNVLDQFEKFDFVKLKLFKAIEHKEAAIGCALSHLNLIEFAKKNNMDYIIVVEDDVLMNINPEEFKKVLKFLSKNFNTFKVFNGSPSFWDKKDAISTIKKKKSHHKRFSFVSDAQKTTFMVYTKNSFNEILEKYNPFQVKLAIDQFFAQNFMQLCYRKYLCYEINSYSDIGKRNVDLRQYMSEQEKLFQSLEEKD